MKINGYAVPVVPLALVAAIFTGAVAYGVQKEKVDAHDKRIEQLEKTPLKVWQIDKRQAEMQKEMEALTREQRDFRQTTVKALDRILRKLDR